MATSWRDLATVAATALGTAVLVMVLVHVAARLVLRRWTHAERFVRAATVPFRTLVLVVAVATVLAEVRGHEPDRWWWEAAATVVRVLAIAAGTWLLAAVVVFVEDMTLGRTRTDVPDNRTPGGSAPRCSIIRRLTIAAFVVVGVGAVLLTFPRHARSAPASWPRPAWSRSWPPWRRSRRWPTSSPASSWPSTTPSASTTSWWWRRSGAGSRRSR